MDEATAKETWLSFVKAQINNPKLNKILAGSKVQSYKQETLTIYIPHEANRQEAENKQRTIANKLGKKYGRFWDDEIQFVSEAVTVSDLQALPPLANPPDENCCNNPLQVLWHEEPILLTTEETEETDKRKEEESRINLLKITEKADRACQEIYNRLTQRIEMLTEEQGINFSVSFPWRVRVGGTRGFRELLLPVFHPVFGIPYIPASSLKGAASAWAKKNGQKHKVEELLGMLDGKKAQAATIQFLDAFPTGPSLSLDIANPQWRWQGNLVSYQSEPHPLLSLKEPEFLVGLVATNPSQNSQDLEEVKTWLKNALASGIGSRVSAGYGRSSIIPTTKASRHKFILFTQNMYGASQDRDGIEFRPTAVRGMLRYWFRAVALGLYSVPQCQELERRLFGGIEPETTEGSLLVAVEWEEKQGSHDFPWHYEGEILLESKYPDERRLAECLLKLASHLGGIGGGSRRPLHWNNGRLRGCHWELDLILPGDKQAWQQHFQEVKDAFASVEKPSTIKQPQLGDNFNRDVLNEKTHIYLIPSPSLIYPEKVTDWTEQGKETDKVRGKALEILYRDDFKGGKNLDVGGGTSNPSYVMIQSNFPIAMESYQAVTVFGVGKQKKGEQQRLKFTKALNQLTPKPIRVW